MNITDVGHLVDDADQGEDKLEAQRAPRAAARSLADQPRVHAGVPRGPARRSGLEPAMVYPRATRAHPRDARDHRRARSSRGYAYQVDGNVYFEVARFPRYGRLSGNRVEDLEAGARIEVREEKRHPADFALWKSDPRHLMKWETRFGPHGFPGWHIECSAMARKHLGDRIDIHTGRRGQHLPAPRVRDRPERGLQRPALRDLLDARQVPAGRRRQDVEEPGQRVHARRRAGARASRRARCASP